MIWSERGWRGIEPHPFVPAGPTTTPPLRVLPRVARSSEYGEGQVVTYKNTHCHAPLYIPMERG